MVKTLKRIKKNGFFYVLLIPCLIYAALFSMHLSMVFSWPLKISIPRLVLQEVNGQILFSCILKLSFPRISFGE